MGFDVVPRDWNEHFGHGLDFGIVEVSEAKYGSEKGVVWVLL